MTDTQKIIKYAAIALAVLIIFGIISGIVTAVGSIIGIGSGVGESRTYETEGEIKSLEVEIGAADFRIEIGDAFSVESNLKNLTFRQTGDRLILREKSLGSKKYEGAFLTVYIPEGTVFSEIDITTGAGKFTAESLSAEKVDLEFGAGEVNIGELNAIREADIEGGAGKITVGGGSLCDLQIDMGVGELVLKSEIVGEGEFNLGVGKVDIILLGGRDNYTVELNKGLGGINFDGESISTGRTMGNGKNNVEINGGIGSITVNFK